MIDTGTIPTVPLPMVSTPDGMVVFVSPPEMISARPRTAPSVASVTMNGCGTRPPTRQAADGGAARRYRSRRRATSRAACSGGVRHAMPSTTQAWKWRSSAT